MLNIVSVQSPVSGNDINSISFTSQNTFLDADVLILNPESYNNLFEKRSNLSSGRQVLYSHNNSNVIWVLFQLRKKEIETLLQRGKIIIVFLNPINFVLAEIEGERDYVTISTYDFLPDSLINIKNNLRFGNGKHCNLIQPNHPFVGYYSALKENLNYQSYLESQDQTLNTFLVNKSEKPIGFSIKYHNGLLVFLPPPPKGIEQEKLNGIITSCSKRIFDQGTKSIRPEWVNTKDIPGVSKISKQINEIQKNIDELSSEKKDLELKKSSIEEFSCLLYENGTPLENIVKKSFEIMGFKVENFKEDDMEHDIIIESEEGRAIGEIEGKDNDLIKIEKLDQLSRVVDEDFTIRGEYPEGLLIGNSYRLYPPKQREGTFSEKVFIAAKRKQYGLISTTTLYDAVIDILNDPNNEKLKKKFREKIFEQLGNEINFT